MRSLLLICGSVRTGSTNAAVLRTAGLLAPEGVAVSSYDELASLPHFNPDDDGENPPAAVAQLRAQLAGAGALLFCTPEYAGALPGSFKNLLDWSVGGGEMSGKPVGWINCSWGGPTGAAGAYAELRTVLTYTDSVIVEPACADVPVTRNDVTDGLVSDPAIRTRLADVVAALAGAIS
jgi:chromate reductase, NAD(P)H dehydrogenase (quinone)